MQIRALYTVMKILIMAAVMAGASCGIRVSGGKRPSAVSDTNLMAEYLLFIAR
jgi:hypothetical protein